MVGHDEAASTKCTFFKMKVANISKNCEICPAQHSETSPQFQVSQLQSPFPIHTNHIDVTSLLIHLTDMNKKEREKNRCLTCN